MNMIEVVKKNNEIADHILKYDQYTPSLLNSLSGIYYLVRYGHLTQKDVYKRRGVAVFNDVIDQLSFTDNIANYSFSNGPIAVGFLLHLMDVNGCELKKGLGKFPLLINDFALAIGEKFRNDQNFDYLYGAIGIAQYFRYSEDEKLRNHFFELLVKELESSAISLEGGVAWVQNRDDNISMVNLGLAHGLPAIIKFLAYCTSSPVYGETANILIDAAVTSLISLYHLWGGIPAEINLKDNSNQPSYDMAWCYSELSTGLALLQAGKICKNNRIIDFAIVLLNKFPTCNPYPIIHNPYICHGTSGISYMFNKLTVKYGFECEKELEAYTLQTLRQCNDLLPFAGFYDTFSPKRSDESNIGLLNGIAGIGLFMNSLLYQDFSWDPIIYLD